MKRLLLTLSLICFSWGAGANSAYAEDYYQLTKGRPTQESLEAKKNGIHLKSYYYFYEGIIYQLGIRSYESEFIISCLIFEKYK